MWQRFTERARRAIYAANEEAEHLGAKKYVSTEHLLLGIVRDEESVAVYILDRIGIASEDVREEVERRANRSHAGVCRVTSLTFRGKRAINLAYDEAKRLQDDHIGTEHLLLGLIRERWGLAGRVLFRQGVRLETTRQALNAIKQERQQNLAGTVPPAPMPVKVAVGDMGVLRADQGHKVVEVVSVHNALQELKNVRQARDSFGYLEMKEQGRLFPVPEGIRIKYLPPPADVPKELTEAEEFLYVQVQEGEFAGQVGWIATGQFARTGSDDAPSPVKM